MKYSRNHELESDRWGVELMTLAQYHPKHLLEVMDILESAAGSGNPPEFLSTHPMPENRREYINQVIEDVFPQGVPEELL
jgi:predicted Zn-dependent protease